MSSNNQPCANQPGDNQPGDNAEPVWTSDLLTQPHRVPDKSRRVRAMFNAIAGRYELVNRVCSLGRDASWRRKAVAMADISPQDDVIDIACGTGDFTRTLAAAGPRCVVGVDFAHQMLLRAGSRPHPGIHWCESDALRLPFAGGSFSVASCAFGIRNFQEFLPGLAEIRRVLKPGGRIVILEFSQPAGRFTGRAYSFYSQHIMPAIATRISGDQTGAYRYLPQSVSSFAAVDEVARQLVSVGFADVTCHPLTMGVVTIFMGVRV